MSHIIREVSCVYFFRASFSTCADNCPSRFVPTRTSNLTESPFGLSRTSAPAAVYSSNPPSGAIFCYRTIANDLPSHSIGLLLARSIANIGAQSHHQPICPIPFPSPTSSYQSQRSNTNSRTNPCCRISNNYAMPCGIPIGLSRTFFVVSRTDSRSIANESSSIANESSYVREHPLPRTLCSDFDSALLTPLLLF